MPQISNLVGSTYMTLGFYFDPPNPSLTSYFGVPAADYQGAFKVSYGLSTPLPTGSARTELVRFQRIFPDNARAALVSSCCSAAAVRPAWPVSSRAGVGSRQRPQAAPFNQPHFHFTVPIGG